MNNLVKELINYIQFKYKDSSNYTSIDYQYKKQVKKSLYLNVTKKAFAYTFLILIVSTMISSTGKIDRAETFNNIIKFIPVILLIYLLVSTSFKLINEKEKNNNDLYSNKEISYGYVLMALCALTSNYVFGSGSRELVVSGIIYFIIIQILMRILVKFSGNSVSNYYDKENLLIKLKYLEKMKNTNFIGEYKNWKVEAKYNDFYDRVIFFTDDKEIEFYNENNLIVDKRSVSYCLLNDNIQSDMLYVLYKELNAKIIDLSVAKNYDKFSDFDVADATQTLIFINGGNLNISDYIIRMERLGKQRSYIYINGTSKLPYYQNMWGQMTPRNEGENEKNNDYSICESE